MRLAAIRVVGIGPFEDLTFRFADARGKPRGVSVVLGGAGVGKTSLLAAVATTRPGHGVVQPRAGFAVADWDLGQDDPARPHPLRVITPNAAAVDAGDEADVARRREQVVFDRRAVDGGGFVVVSLSGARWFSRAPVLLASPERTLLRYDARAGAVFDDATRADLARETKQVLAYAGVSAALGGLETFDASVRAAVSATLAPAGFSYRGVDARSLEPTFDPGRLTFDDLPSGARHLVAMAALPIRALFAAHATSGDARQLEGVVLVDDAERQLDPPVQRALVPALREALPCVQWIVTTSSPLVAEACDPGEVVALRRMDASQRVELFDGELARLH